MAKGQDQDLQGRHCLGRQPARRILDDPDQLPDVGWALRHDLTEFRQVATKRVDELGALTDQHFSDPKDHG